MTVKKSVKDAEPKRVRKSRAHSGEIALEINAGAAREIIARLARAEGQVRAVQRMIDERRDCHAIVQQLAAARTALQRATSQLMVSNLAQCIRTAKNGSDEVEIQKLMDTFIKLL